MIFTTFDTLKNIFVQLLISNPVLFSFKVFFISSYLALVQSMILF